MPVKMNSRKSNKNIYKCVSCGMEYTALTGNFYKSSSKSPLWLANSGYAPICKTCIDNWLSQSRTCPFKCNNMTFNESRIARSMLSNLLFKCASCGEVIKYENCELHSHACSYKHSKGNTKRSKFDKYDEVEIETHEHALTIVKDAKMRKTKKSNNNTTNTINNDTKYYWTCSICAKHYSLDLRSAVCETCTNYEVCEDCISHKAIQWLVHIII